MQPNSSIIKENSCPHAEIIRLINRNHSIAILKLFHSILNYFPIQAKNIIIVVCNIYIYWGHLSTNMYIYMYVQIIIIVYT